MSYEIKFYKEAIKNLRKLDKTTRNRILDHINILSENPSPYVTPSIHSLIVFVHIQLIHISFICV